MRVVVCNRLTEYLGIQIISASLKKAGHTVELVFEPDLLGAAFVRNLPPAVSRRVDSARRAARRVVARSPDMVLFPSEINSFDWCCRVAQDVKDALPDAWMVHGGFHVTASPEDCIGRDGVDALCVGEGDLAVPELVEAVAAGRDTRSIPNIWVRGPDGTIHRNSPRPLVADLDTLPFPDKDLYYGPLPGLAREYMCVASRGCHWACSFCFYTTLYDLYAREGFVRTRSPEHVAAELERAKSRWDVRNIVFHDDIFPTSLAWLRRFAPLYRERVGLPFSCITHPQLIKDDAAELLGSMGCRYVIMGAQTVNERSRAPDILNRTETNEDVARATRLLKEQGIFVLLDHIFGIPGETLDDQEEALAFYSELGPDVVKPFFMAYFPGTDLTRRTETEHAARAHDPEKTAEPGWDHFMFEGSLSGEDFRPWNLAYAMFPVLGRRGRRLMLRLGLHRKLAPLARLPGMGNVILFPRLITGLLDDRDVRPKLYLNYLRTIAGYKLRERLLP